MELNENLRKKLSKFMSLVLRHKPEAIGIELDREGWCDFQDFLSRIQKSSPRWHKLTEENIRTVVDQCNKQRFTIKDGNIRANQGHSNKEIEVKFSEIVPQHNLYHGTSRTAWQQIQQSGLIPMKRHHVHLSPNLETAQKVGRRHDRNPVILSVDIKKALASGIQFYVSENNVYLCKHIPPEFLQVLE